MLCISRVTNEESRQKFGDGYHKFYLEFRCNLPCLDGKDTCVRCLQKSSTSKIQHARTFDHGKVTEPIKDTSHIYGGKWYNDNVKRYGMPPENIIELAESHKSKAHDQPVVEPVLSVSDPEQPKITKTKRKPKVAEDTSNIETNTKQPPKNPPTKKSATPYSSLINTRPQLVHKEVTLPTHIETKLEEFDIDGFKIEYVRLKLFEHENMSYFIDSKKNKLYRVIRGKIGQYVGRFNSENNSIVTDIPDSDDDEN